MKKWFRLPLQEKLKYLTFSAGAVVFLSIAANMLVAFFGLGGFGSILKDNSQSLAFWTSMDEESAAFDKYIQERSDESPLNTGILEKNGMPGHGHCAIFMKIMRSY